MSLKKQFSKSKPVCKVTFDLPKDAVNGGKNVMILGDFNNWEPKKGLKMKSGKSGFTASLDLATGKEYEFRYLIDKINWTNDWHADAYRPSPYYGIDNSVIFLAAAPTKKAKKKETPKKETKKKVSLKAVEKKAAPKKAAAKKTTAKKTAPKKTVAKKTVPDDLKKIEGVGPKIAGLLIAGGFKTFAALGKAKKTEIKAILDKAGKRYQMHDPTTWPKQAKLAAAGKWDQLSKLQDVLKGGK